MPLSVALVAGVGDEISSPENIVQRNDLAVGDRLDRAAVLAGQSGPRTGGTNPHTRTSTILPAGRVMNCTTWPTRSR
jgi:hypothetical protein